MRFKNNKPGAVLYDSNKYLYWKTSGLIVQLIFCVHHEETGQIMSREFTISASYPLGKYMNFIHIP